MQAVTMELKTLDEILKVLEGKLKWHGTRIDTLKQDIQDEFRNTEGLGDKEAKERSNRRIRELEHKADYHARREDRLKEILEILYKSRKPEG